ncbi:MlaD family protein [Patulibacter sp. NPDC049589]|uniref:MlaD family protein n=1 Tax=Patulibacter sp. NPDC049589 TaxID=3154731 RepID=UPI003423D029
MSKRTQRRGGRGMFEIRPGQHRPKNIRNGTIFIVLIALLLFVIYAKPTVPGFGTEGQKVVVNVANGINIRPGSTPVRVNGVEVGAVTKVDRAPSGRGVRVELLVEKGKGVKVHKDASVAFRWRTLLGRNLYADLKPGSASAPVLASSDVIPESHTEVQTELDQAVEPLDTTGRKALQTIVKEFDKGFGSASAYKRTVKALGPALSSLGPGLESVRGTEPGDLQKMIQKSSRVLGAVASDEAKLGEFINSGSVALGVTAARSADVRSLLASAPGALQETRTTMARLRKTLDVLDPVAQELRPGARKLAGSADDANELLTAAAPLLKDAKPTVRALKPAVQDLTKLTTSGNDLMAAANPVLDDAIYPILPYLRTPGVVSKRKLYTMIGPAISVGDAGTAWGDSRGTFGNFEAGAGEGTIPAFSPCQTWITDGTVPPDQKINCDAAVRIIAALVTGTSPDQIDVKGAAAPAAKSKSLLDSKQGIQLMTKSLAADKKKEAGR